MLTASFVYLVYKVVIFSINVTFSFDLSTKIFLFRLSCTRCKVHPGHQRLVCPITASVSFSKSVEIYLYSHVIVGKSNEKYLKM